MQVEKKTGGVVPAALRANIRTRSMAKLKNENMNKRHNVNVFLTVKQLNDACKKHTYILVLFASGDQMAINSKIAPIAKRRKDYNDNDLTNITGFIPCDFSTYIKYKRPFITINKNA